MLVEAAWAAAKAPGPLRAFFLRIRARRGHQIAAVAVARKLAVLCWHLLTKSADYQWARPALVANKLRSIELQTGQPARKGNKRGAAYAYNINELRDREIELARHARMPSCSGDWAGSGCPDSSSPMTRPPLSNGTCANSIGSARIWLVSTVRSRRRRSTIRRSSDC